MEKSDVNKLVEQAITYYGLHMVGHSVTLTLRSQI